jgi:branched-chain amino acid transport system substrate-binding protein
VRDLARSYTLRVLVSVVLCGFVLTASCTRPPEEIRIGVIATTGVELMLSSTLNAVEMVRSDLEEEGGLLVDGRKHSVRFVIERIEGGVPEQAVAAASRLINQESVVAIIGPDFSIDAIPVGEVAERASIPLISPLSSHPRTTAGRKYVFRVAFLDSFQARGMARFCVRDLKARKIAVLYNVANPYSRGIAEVFRTTVLMEEGMIVAFEKYTTEETDFSEQLNRIKKSDPEILYLPNFFQEVGPIAVQARKIGIGAILVGGEAWYREKFAQRPQFEGSYMTAHWTSDMPDERSREFLKEYQTRFGRVPEDGAALTYDGIQLLLSAITSQKRIDSESIRDGLYALGPYEGVTGTIDYIDDGNPQREAVVLRFEGGNVRFVRKIAAQ